MSRVVPDKLTGHYLVKNSPKFYGTRRLITTLTTICHLSLSSARSIHSIRPHPTSGRSILMLSKVRHTVFMNSYKRQPEIYSTLTTSTAFDSNICTANFSLSLSLSRPLAHAPSSPTPKCYAQKLVRTISFHLPRIL